MSSVASPILDYAAARDTRASPFDIRVCLILSAGALGAALQVNYGQFQPSAMGWLGLSVLLCLVAVARSRADSRDSKLELPVLAGVVLIQFVQLLSRHPGIAELGPTPSLIPFEAGVAMAAVAVAVALFGSGRLRTTAVGVMLVLHLLLGLWTLRALPTPAVDVLTFQRDSCRAILEGRNPYAITFPDESPAGSRFYGEGLSKDGRLQFGYPYPPITLLLTLPGYLAGDVRLVHLLALTLAGTLIAFSRPGRRASGAAALLLFTPRGFFVLQAGWIEPIVELGLAMVVFIACRIERHNESSVAELAVIPRSGSDKESRVREPVRFPRSLVAPLLGMTEPQELELLKAPSTGRWQQAILLVALGLFLSTKQYLILALPACLLLPGVRTKLRSPQAWLTTFGLPLLIGLPFLIWSARGFLHSVALLQFHQPPRTDALSFLSPLAQSLPSSMTAILPFAAAGAVFWFARGRAPKSAGGFCLALAATFLVFFALNKQAFCNYYHFVLAAEYAALASISNAKSATI